MKKGVEIISNTIHKIIRTNRLGIVATLVAAAVVLFSCTKDEKADNIKVGGSGKGIAFTSMLGGSNSTGTKAASGATVAEHYEIAAEFADGTISDELFTIEILPNDGSYDSYDAATKTVYGEDYKEGGRVTRSTIHWEAGDLITIYSNQAKIGSYNNINRTATSNPINSDTACYKITSNTLFENFKYKGKIEPVENGNGLWWGENTQDHYFIGSYPAIKQVAGSYTKGGTPANSSITLSGLNYSVKQSDGSFTQDVVLDGSVANQYNPELTKYGYMYAGTKVAKENVPASTVNLEFTPNFTAYEVNLTNDKLTGDGESMILKRVTIESAQDIAAEGVSTILQFDDSDNFKFSNDLSVITEATSKSKKITINFKKSDGTDALPITLPTGGNYLKFTILTLGKTDIGYQTDVKIKFEMEYNESKVNGSGTDKIHRIMTLTLKDEDGTSNMRVTEGKKVVIKNGKMTTGFSTLSTNVDAIVFAKSDEDVNGYSIDSLGITSERRADGTLEPWEIFALVNGSEVAYGTADWPEWIRLDKNKSATKITDTVAIKINPGALDRATATITSPAAGFITELKNATPIGNESTPRDLSLYDIYGVEYGSATSKVTSITTSGSHTANSYVVSAPGYYCFPLVYGNAIGYTVNNNTDEKLKKTYSTFDNADGNKITSPYILDDNLTLSGDYEAFVLWQDVLPGAEVILNKDISVVEAPAGAGLTCKYIKFRIEKDNILPCNAVIALRDRKNDKILWSWHIWVAPMNQAASDTYYNWNQIYPFTFKSISDVDINANILNCNLGWCPPINYTGVTQEKCDTLRIKQKGLSSTYKDIIISQESYTVLNKGELFSYTYYQFGRKDPFIGFNGEKNGEGYSVNKPFSSIKKGYDIYGDKKEYPSTYHLKGGSYNVSKTDKWIRNPYIYNENQSYGLINLWNHSQTTTAIDSECYNYTDKSVYDPSPAGFCVPPSVFGKAFAVRARAGNYGTNVYGSKVDKNATLALPAGALLSNTGSATENHKLFFPQAIQRKGSSGRLIVTELTTIRYWTSSANKTTKIYAGTFRIFMNGTFGLQPVSDDAVSQNQGQPVRPVLEQSH